VAAWLPGVLRRIHKLANEGKVRLTVKALAEVRGLGLGLGVGDVVDMLTALSAADSAGRLRSSASFEWLYVFKPTAAFHRDESDEEGS
jgi:hypothetical protein